MHISPYLTFNGDCEQAFAFYADVFGVTPTVLMRFKDFPGPKQTPDSWDGKIMHAQIDIGPAQLMGSDQHDEHYARPQGLHGFSHGRDAGGGRADFQRTFRRRPDHHADGRNFLGATVRHAGRSLWHPLHDRMQQGALTAQSLGFYSPALSGPPSGRQTRR